MTGPAVAIFRSLDRRLPARSGRSLLSRRVQPDEFCERTAEIDVLEVTGIRAASRSLLLSLLPVLVMVSVAALLTMHFSDQLAANRARARHTYEVIDTARSLLSDIQDAETGQRGFIITGRPDYLSPYQSATAALPDRLAKLQRLTAGDPEQARRFGELED